MLQLLFLFFFEQLLCRGDRSAHSDLFHGSEPLSDLPGVGADAVWRSGRCVLERRGPALRSDPHQPGRLFYMPTRSHRGQAVHLNVKLWAQRGRVGLFTPSTPLWPGFRPVWSQSLGWWLQWAVMHAVELQFHVFETGSLISLTAFAVCTACYPLK